MVGVVLGNESHGPVVIVVGDSVDQRRVHDVAVGEGVGHRLFPRGLDAERMGLDDVEQAGVERPKHRVRAYRGDGRVQLPVGAQERHGVRALRRPAHVPQDLPQAGQVCGGGVPEGILDEQRVKGIADPDRLGDRSLAGVVEGEHGIAQPDHRRLPGREQAAPGAGAHGDHATGLRDAQRLVECPDGHLAPRPQLLARPDSLPRLGRPGQSHEDVGGDLGSRLSHEVLLPAGRIAMVPCPRGRRGPLDPSGLKSFMKVIARCLDAGVPWAHDLHNQYG